MKGSSCWLAALAIGAASAGCASSNPYRASFKVPLLSVRGESEVAIGGVQIGLSPITRENESHFPQIARPVTWRQPQAQPPSQMGQARPAVRSAERSGFVELIPLPAFFVGIANNTGAAISFTQAKIERRHPCWKTG